MKRTLRSYLLALGLMAAGLPAAWADIYVVVNAANPVKAMSQKEALDVFMGRRRSFASGVVAAPFDLPRDSGARAQFYQTLTGMSLPQVNSYWARLMFTGQTLPPQLLGSEDAMVEAVKQDITAIGYLSRAPEDGALRVVLVLKEPQ